MGRKKSPSRLDKRKEAEAAEALEASGTKKKKTKKKAAKKKTTRVSRKKVKTSERRKIVWGVYSASMKEEARFPYNEKKEAEKKVEQLKARGKKLYFMQPIKEVITDAEEVKAETEE